MQTIHISFELGNRLMGFHKNSFGLSKLMANINVSSVMIICLLKELYLLITVNVYLRTQLLPWYGINVTLIMASQQKWFFLSVSVISVMKINFRNSHTSNVKRTFFFLFPVYPTYLSNNITENRWSNNRNTTATIPN